MATNLYQEAIAEAKQLKEMAEQSAKNKIIEAITPQIRSLVESRLLGELDDMDSDSDDLEVGSMMDDDEEDDVEVEMGSSDDSLGDAAISVSSISSPDSSSDEVSLSVEPGAPVDINISSDGSVSIDSDGFDIDISDSGMGGDDVEEEDELILSQEAARALSKILNTPGAMSKSQIAEGLLSVLKRARALDNKLDEHYVEIMSYRDKKKIRNYFRKLIGEAINLRNQLILSERDSRNDPIGRKASMVFKEIEEMARRRHGDLLDNLFEEYSKREGSHEMMGEEDANLDELDAVLTLEPADDEEAEELEGLGLDDIEIDILDAGGEEDAGDEGGEAEEEEFSFEEMSDDEGEEEDDEETVEIEESMLRRELLRLREATEGSPEAAEMADSFGGGEVEDEIFVDVDEDDLLNALADELGDPSVPAPTVESYRRRARRRARPIRESRSRARRRTSAGSQKLNEYRRAVHALKGQLSEMNLFNAKLLYVNKLMQNRNLSTRQQKVIVEALDNAKTLREAKLLYKSLTSSLNKKSRRLSESRIRRTLGSASKSARSAQRLDEGAGSMNRWAVLAGINTSK